MCRLSTIWVSIGPTEGADWLEVSIDSNYNCTVILTNGQEGSPLGHSAVRISNVVGNGCGNESVGKNVVCCTDGWAHDSTDDGNSHWFGGGVKKWAL